MRIVLDLQGAQSASRHRGIGRYTLSLAKAIVANRKSHEVLIALNGLIPDTVELIRSAFDTLLPQDNIRVWLAPGPVWDNEAANASRRKIAERIREAFLVSLKPDMVHVSSLFEGFGDNVVTSIGKFAPQLPTAVTLYDLIPLTSSDPHAVRARSDPRFRDHYARKLKSFCRANIWLGISEFSCQEAIARLHLDADKFVNIGCAADPHFTRIDLSDAKRTHIMQTYGLQKPFICWVGTPEDDRKNLAGLLQAFARLAPALRARFQILIIGKPVPANSVEPRRMANKLGLGPRQVVFAGYVNDNELAELYNICHAFVFPSLYEGFGLPALEAMQCGAPVIASNTTSVPEVVGLQDALFDPYSVEDLADKLRRVLIDDEFRATLVTHHLERAQRFSWDQCAKKAITAFEDCHARSGTQISTVPSYQNLIASTAQILGQELSGMAVLNTAIAIAQNYSSSNSERTLFIDVSELNQQNETIASQRAARNILKQLLDRPPQGYKVEPVYAKEENFGYRYARRLTRTFLGHEQGGEEDTLIDLRQGDVFFVLDFQHHVVMRHRDFYGEIRNLGAKVYFLLCDLLPTHFPQSFHSGISDVHHKWLSVISQSDGVVCVSRTVANQYLGWLSTNETSRSRPLRIGWYHLAIGPADLGPVPGLPERSRAVLSALAGAPSFLMVGAVEPWRQYAQALAAFEELWQKGNNCRLVIVGERGRITDQLNEQLRHHPKLGTNLFWLEDVGDEYLDAIYSACSCLIAASEEEGFGLPLIEAAQHKLPILARDIPVFREIVGDHGSYFHGLTAEGLATAITDWLTLYTAGRHPRSDDMPWPTWTQSVEHLKAILFGGDWYAAWPPRDCGADTRSSDDPHELNQGPGPALS